MRITPHRPLGGVHQPFTRETRPPTSPALARAVEQRIKAEDHTFFVVVPATPLKDQTDSFPGGAVMGSPPEDRAYALAVQPLDQALEQIRKSG